MIGFPFSSVTRISTCSRSTMYTTAVGSAALRLTAAVLSVRISTLDQSVSFSCRALGYASVSSVRAGRSVLSSSDRAAGAAARAASSALRVSSAVRSSASKSTLLTPVS